MNRLFQVFNWWHIYLLLSKWGSNQVVCSVFFIFYFQSAKRCVIVDIFSTGSTVQSRYAAPNIFLEVDVAGAASRGTVHHMQQGVLFGRKTHTQRKCGSNIPRVFYSISPGSCYQAVLGSSSPVFETLLGDPRDWTWHAKKLLYHWTMGPSPS